MGESILIFFGSCLTIFICIIALIGIPVLFIIFIVAIIQDFWHRWKGKGGANYRFPPW